jgi:hypothetical protein
VCCLKTVFTNSLVSVFLFMIFNHQLCVSNHFFGWTF